MSNTLAPDDVSHYYQRLAELSTLPFWQREEFTEPTGPERGHVWHQLTASEGELVLLRLTDRPIHDVLGLYQAEEEM